VIDHADVMVIGIGDLDGWVVELLVRLPGMKHKKILIAGKNEEAVRKGTFSA
jgi:tRNA A37 threonylcarbamoyladenosine dehydratase